MKQVLLLLAVLGFGFFAAGCEIAEENQFKPMIVLQGFLYANEQIDTISVRKTISIEDTSRASDFVQNAQVEISVDGRTYTLREKNKITLPGRYFLDTPLTAIPGKTYRLTVRAFGEEAWSETTIPYPIQLDSVKIDKQRLALDRIDTILYPKDISELSRPGVHLWWTSSSNAVTYALEAVSFDTTQKLIDLELPGAQPPDSTTSRGRYRFFILSNNEELAWLQYRYYGLNTVRALALDKNYSDLILGIFLTGSQFNNQTLHVNGGLGIFGSAARASKEVYLKKP